MVPLSPPVWVLGAMDSIFIYTCAPSAKEIRFPKFPPATIPESPCGGHEEKVLRFLPKKEKTQEQLTGDVVIVNYSWLSKELFSCRLWKLNLPSTSMVWLGEIRSLAAGGESTQLSQKSCSREIGPPSSCLPPTPATNSVHRQIAAGFCYPLPWRGQSFPPMLTLRHRSCNGERGWQR